MQGMTYHKIYPFGMLFENDKFTDEKKIKHPTTPAETSEVDADDKPESASQAPLKSLFQPISNKYEDNVDPTKDLRRSKQIKEKKKDTEDYITESTAKDEASVIESIASTDDPKDEFPSKPIQELPVKKS